MSRSRLSTIACLLKGLIAAVILTLILMLLLALAVVYLQFSDDTIRWLNQFIKIAAVIFGVRIAVGRGGEKGFITGTVLAVLYMITGYVMYLTLGGNVFDATSMLGEILIGAAAGSIAGAVFANLKPKKGRKKH